LPRRLAVAVALVACILPAAAAGAAVRVFPGCGETLAKCIKCSPAGTTIRLKTNALIPVPVELTVKKGFSLEPFPGYEPQHGGMSLMLFVDDGTARMRAHLYNTISSNAKNQGIVFYEAPELTVTGDANATWNAGGGDILGSYDIGTLYDTDPLYANVGGGDYRLQARSPLVDAGRTCIARMPLPRGDAAHRFRVAGLGVVVGAFEHGSKLAGSVPGRNRSGSNGKNTNTLLGGGAADRIFGGLGADRTYGGPGRDRIDVEDGVEGNDLASGGPDADVCFADPGDRIESCTSGEGAAVNGPRHPSRHQLAGLPGR
jgi:hypothetical protein